MSFRYESKELKDERKRTFIEKCVRTYVDNFEFSLYKEEKEKRIDSLIKRWMDPCMTEMLARIDPSYPDMLKPLTLEESWEDYVLKEKPKVRIDESGKKIYKY